MDKNDQPIANALELILMNQDALRAGLEEVAVWSKHKGSINLYEDLMSLVSVLDMNAESLTGSIERLRQDEES